jgi:hypothetical protein
MNDADLWTTLHRNMAHLNEVAEAADALPADTDVAWTGRTMKVPWFAEHMREELVLHNWDITGDNVAAQAQLAQPWMTTHSVWAVGKPLLVKGAAQLQPGERIEARLRAQGVDDVVVRADAEGTTIELSEIDGPATLETDSAARVLLLWGRRPADPSRIVSGAGPDELGRVRTLLSGY